MEIGNRISNIKIADNLKHWDISSEDYKYLDNSEDISNLVLQNTAWNRFYIFSGKMLSDLEIKEIGFVMIHFDLINMNARIQMVFIKPEFRGFGISKEIIGKAIEIIRNNGFFKVKICAEEDNIKSLSSIRKNFTNEYILKDEILRKDKTGERKDFRVNRHEFELFL